MTGPHTSKTDEEFFAAIGRLTISWGHLGIGLDGIVEILYYGFNGKTLVDEIPRSLRRKITFMRAALRRLPIGEEAINGFMMLLDKIETASQKRHDIIHGVVIEHTEGSGEATMVRATRGKNGVTKREFKVTTTTILRAANEAQKLSGTVLRWLTETHRVIDELAQRGNGQTPS